MGGGKFQFFIKFVVLLFVCTAFVACNDSDVDSRNEPITKTDRFGIGLERPEDTGLTAFKKRKLKQFRSESLEEMKERLKRSIFYRVKAEYSHKDRKTGEIENIKFDFVAMCGGRVLMDAKGYTVSETDGVNPANYFEPTADDGLIMMRVPSACRSGQFIKEVPDDFTPFVVWFDNVHKLSHGLGYATEDAYESPISQLKFHRASIKRANLDEWLVWREEQLERFKPIGFVRSPWGVSLAGNEPERDQSKIGVFPYIYNLSSCSAQRRVKLPEAIQAKLRQLWPNGAPDFWSEVDAGIEPYSLNEMFKNNENFTGGSIAAGDLIRTYHGITTNSGKGYLYSRSKKIVGEYYPKYKSRREPTNIEKRDERRIIPILEHIEFQPKMRGFVACGGLMHSSDVSVRKLGFEQGDGHYLNTIPIWTKNSGNPRPPYFFESTIYMWRGAN